MESGPYKVYSSLGCCNGSMYSIYIITHEKKGVHSTWILASDAGDECRRLNRNARKASEKAQNGRK